MNPDVSIIILNWNGLKDTLECLKSLHQVNYPNYNIIVVDNYSSDNSLFKIREYAGETFKIGYNFFEYCFKDDIYLNEEKKKNFELTSSKNLIIIKNDENYGFAKGNNIGIRYALNNLNSQYILLLNNDTVVDKEFLSELINVAESDKNIGSVQSLLLKPGGKTIDSIGQEISLWGAEDKGINSKLTQNIDNTEIFGACAAAALYPGKIFEEIGLFDEDFFIILEDIDISWKIRLKGLKSILASKSIVYHKRGISEAMSINEILFGKKTPQTIFKWYHGSKNWLIIVVRYYSISLFFRALIKYPHKFFFTFFKCFYSSLKMRKFREVSLILYKNLKFRKKVKNNSLLTDLQTEWIKY